MIAAVLRVEIERYAADMPAVNPLFTKAASGRFSKDRMVSYLTNVRHLSCEAQAFLDVAGQRASDLGEVALAKHYAQKRHEERGHEAWADRDIARVSMGSQKDLSTDILPSIRALIDFLGRTIDEDPSLYLAYTLFSEYLVVLLGGKWLLLLEERCAIPRSSMTVIDNHIDLDREHVQEALDQIDALVGDPRKLPRMRSVLRETLTFFDRFCAEVTRDGDDGLETSDGRHQVSAA